MLPVRGGVAIPSLSLPLQMALKQPKETWL